MRTMLALIGLISSPLALNAQGTTVLDAKSKSELLATRELAWRAWFGGDRAALEAMLPAEFIAIGWDAAPWENKASTIEASQGFARDGGKLSLLEFPKTEIQAYGDVAIVYSTYRVGFTAGGQEVLQEGRATEVFVRRGGKWLHPGWHLDSVK